MTFVHHEKLFTMKTRIKTAAVEKDFDAVKFQRTVREKIAKETEGMSFKELKAYFKKRRVKAK